MHIKLVGQFFLSSTAVDPKQTSKRHVVCLISIPKSFGSFEFLPGVIQALVSSGCPAAYQPSTNPVALSVPASELSESLSRKCFAITASFWAPRIS
jgi:hypothetical protein